MAFLNRLPHPSVVVSQAEAMTTPALSLDNVTCTFPARGDRGTYTAIRDVSLTVADGEFVSLVGPTGCGKSTLLNAAAGLLAADLRQRVGVRPAAGRHQPRGRLSVPGRCAVSLAQRAGQRHRGAGVPRCREGRGAGARDRVAHARRTRAAHGQVSARAVRRHAQARGAGADLDPRAAHPADGRAVQRARRADPTADGERAAGDCGRRPPSPCCS